MNFKSLLLKTILLAIGSYALLLVVVYLFQERLLYFPSSRPFLDCRGMRSIQQEASGDEVPEVRYHLIPGKDAVASIIVYHGNAGSACDRAFLKRAFSSLNVNWILVEYPGYAGSSEKLNQEKILRSSLAAFDSARVQIGKDQPVFILGESLGTGVATYVAANREASGLILISPYTSIEEVAQSKYPFLPVSLLIRDRFPASTWAAQIKAPTIILHGTHDAVIEIEFGRKQAGAFNPRAEFVELPRSGHNDWMDADGDAADRAVSAFFARTLN